MIAVCGFAFIVAILIFCGYFDAVSHLALDHDNWHTAAFCTASPAVVASCSWFTYRRWRQSRRLTDELNTAFEKCHQMELELLEAQRLGTLGQLAGGLAHEINNTLQPVFSLAGLCLDQADLPDRTRERVEKIVAAAERGRNISRRALIYSAEREGDTLPVNLSETITDILAFLDETTISSVRIDPAIVPSSATVRVQPTELMQVLTNLVTNSADAMGSKGIVRVSCDYPSAEDDPLVSDFPDSRGVARISVADHGVGMKEGIRQRVFEPFFSTKKPRKGTGLGLSIVYGIVERWGGRIRIDSTEGEGTAVYVLVPLEPHNTTNRRGSNE